MEKPTKEYKTTPINYEKTKGSSRGILWLFVVLVIGIVGYLFISSGGKEVKSKLSGVWEDDDDK